MTVHLVGVGPGDPDLLTLRAASLLARADVIVHDRLVDARILAWAAPWAEVIEVGTSAGSMLRSQAEINSVLVDRGRRVETVVRLTGGDPFVFGRGGEEAVALRSAGIEVEVVPGISSSIAAPAAAGIPVTMHGISSGVTIVTAHQDPRHDHSVDWTALARAGTTLVILMGAAHANGLSERLRAGGMRHDMPVAIITRATCVDECITRTTLDELGRISIEDPSTIVVGAVAASDVLSGAIVPSVAGVGAPEGAT